uniref:CCHC-type domain-containing protein n=1 Tax=Acanthochromis polyacanthus TaxID=80966 RepID=A0A3Q1G3B7_9TELE
MKSFERLVLSHLKSIVGPLLDPMQITLRSLSSSNSALYKQVALFTEKVNRLTNCLALAGPAVNASSDRKHHVPTPERHNGHFGACQAFLTQVSLVFELQLSSYSTDRSHIAYLIGQLMGDAQDWGTAVWKCQGPLCDSYTEFVEEMRRNFGHPVSSLDATTRLGAIQQGALLSTRSIAGRPICLFCGESGHFVAACPRHPTKGGTHQ